MLILHTGLLILAFWGSCLFMLIVGMAGGYWLYHFNVTNPESVNRRLRRMMQEEDSR